MIRIKDHVVNKIPFVMSVTKFEDYEIWSEDYNYNQFAWEGGGEEGGMDCI